MVLYIDRETGGFINHPDFKAPVTDVTFKRGDAAKVSIKFVTGNTVAPLLSSGSPQVKFGIKESGKFDGGFVVFADDYTLTDGVSYDLTPSFNTEELNDVLNSGDENDSNDVASVTTMLEVTWSVDGGSSWSSSNTIVATILNDVIKGGEGIIFAQSEAITESTEEPINGTYTYILSASPDMMPNGDGYILYPITTPAPGGWSTNGTQLAPLTGIWAKIEDSGDRWTFFISEDEVQIGIWQSEEGDHPADPADVAFWYLDPVGPTVYGTFIFLKTGPPSYGDIATAGSLWIKDQAQVFISLGYPGIWKELAFV